MNADKCCLGCTERHYLCHATCERHKRAKEKHDAAQAEIRMRRDKERRADNTIITLKENAKKRRGDR
jgi:hypothetical protein